MTERWQRELQKLRQLEPPATTWSRVKQGARSRAPEPSNAGRVVAGIVAFVVFAAAGVFAWRAFSGQPTTVGRLGPPSEQVVRIDLAAGADGDLGAVLRSGTAEAAGVRFPVEVSSTGGSSFNPADLVATFPPPTFAPIPSDANFRLSGGAQPGTVHVRLISAEVVEAATKHLVPSRNLTQGEGDLTWDLQGVSLSQGPPLTVESGRQYMLAVMGRTVAGEEFGFSFGVVIEENRATLPATPSGAEALVGQEYADYLGLELLNAEPADCNSWYTVKGKTGYCLDDVVGDTVETWIVVERLRGHLPSEQEIQIFALQTRIANLGSSPEDKKIREQLIARLVELQADAGIDIPESNATIPNVALIRCTESGTELITPTVRPQSDGVHFEIDNQAAARTVAVWRFDDQGSAHWDAGVKSQAPVSTAVLPLRPPDRYFVQCILPRADSDTIKLSRKEAQPIEIVDPDGAG